MGYISFSRNPCEDYTQLLRFPIILIMKNHHDKSDPLLILLADIGLSQIHGIDAQTIQYFYLLNSLSSSLCKWTDLKNIIPPLHILVSNTFEWSLGKKCANISFLLPMSVLDPNAAYQSGIKHISYSSVTDFGFFCRGMYYYYWKYACGASYLILHIHPCMFADCADRHEVS